MGMIVCLGWGSLCWDPRTLPVEAGAWKTDGPALPIEFTRVSSDDRVTLVITPGAATVPVLWTKMGLDDLDAAVDALADRENIQGGNTPYSIGIWSAERKSDHAEGEVIGAWAAGRDIDAVIWTALKPRFRGESGRIPGIDDVIATLGGLTGETRSKAEEYVRRAPAQISTPYRTMIEERLGWTIADPAP